MRPRKDRSDSNKPTRYAVIYQLLVIGEATKRLSDVFRQEHRVVPWKNIAGLRDILIHSYDDVDLDEVWRIASERVPALLARLEPVVADKGNR